MRLTPEPEVEEAPGQFWKDYIRETAPVFRTPTIEQLEGFIEPTFQALVDGAKYVDERLVEIIDEVQPDVLVEDNVVSFPALPASGRPWVRIVSCNPAEIKDPDVPPAFSGYPAGRPLGLGRIPGRVPRATHAAAARRLRRLLPRARRAAAARPRVRPRRRSTSTCGSTRRRSTTPRARPLEPRLAQPRGQRPRDRRRVGSSPSSLAYGEGPLRLPQPRLARRRATPS